MGNFTFQRECRTPNSECHTVFEGENTVGRLDIHFTSTVIHATLNVTESLTSDAIQELIDTMDVQLMDSVGVGRQEIIVHVHQGRDLGVFNTRDFDGNGGYQRLS